MKQYILIIFLATVNARYSVFDMLSPSNWKAGVMVEHWPVLVNQIEKSFTDFFPNDILQDSNLSAIFNVPKLIAEAGYPIEVHHVTTKDGYILELHRIPHGRFRDEQNKNNRPILLNHCLLCSSSTFIAPGPGKALGYLLADIGYDVWIMNDRGNTYSRNHTFLSPKEKKFWLFSMDEIGMYDLPATIDYILQNTKWKQIDYVGFSMGTATFVVLMNEWPQYNKIVRQAALLAPVISGHYAKGPFVRLTRLSKQIEGMLRGFDATEEIPPPELRLNDFLLRSCSINNLDLEDFCDTAFYLVEGLHIKEVSKKSKAKFFRSFPNRGSVMQLKHYSQVFKDGFFRRFSYGRRENMKKYGQTIPPSYNFTKLTTPIGIFWSPYDKFESSIDIKILASQIGNLQLLHRIPYEKFAHTNFIWDDNVYDRLHSHVLEYLKGFSMRNMMNLLKKQVISDETLSSGEFFDSPTK